MSSQSNDISQEVSNYMKKCGIPNKLHSQMLFNICNIVFENKDSKKIKSKSLFSSVNILKTDAWEHALRIIFTFLKENHMDLTLATMKTEHKQFQDEEINSLSMDDDIGESADQILQDLINSSSKKDFHDLVLSFLSELPLKNSIDHAKELYPDINSSESLEQDNSNNVSDDSGLNFSSFHDD